MLDTSFPSGAGAIALRSSGGLLQDEVEGFESATKGSQSIARLPFFRTKRPHYRPQPLVRELASSTDVASLATSANA